MSARARALWPAYMNAIIVETLFVAIQWIVTIVQVYDACTTHTSTMRFVASSVRLNSCKNSHQPLASCPYDVTLGCIAIEVRHQSVVVVVEMRPLRVL